jgi:sigma54-dependent transcription regulator
LAVLIEGATGTGKELVAALLHQESGRTGSLVSFNVCAISETMFEDALFGHTKGAFTGAATESLGFLREANGGTVFFDEISGLPGAQRGETSCARSRRASFVRSVRRRVRGATSVRSPRRTSVSPIWWRRGGFAPIFAIG